MRPIRSRVVHIFFSFFLSSWLSASGGLEIVTTTLPVAVVGRPYTPSPITVQGGGACAVNGVHFRVTSGRLPPGVSLSHGGYFDGTPTAMGTYRFVVRAENACMFYARALILKVDGPAILRVDPEALDFHYRKGGPAPTPKVIQISGSWPGLPYWAEAPGAAWLILQPAAGRTPPEGAALTRDSITVAVDAANLAPGVYRTLVRISAVDAAQAPSVAVTLRVE